MNNKANKKDNYDHLLKEWLGICESQACSTKVISEQIPKLNEIITENVNDISQKFKKINQIHETILEITNVIKKENTLDLEKIKDLENQLRESDKMLVESVKSLQFQDFISQNMVITSDVLNSITDYIEKEIDTSIPSINKNERKKLINKDFTKKLLHDLRLGELQKSFIRHLIEHNYIESASDLGFEDDINQKPEEDNVELF